MLTVLVTPRIGDYDHREDWEIARGSPPHVDFVTDDLTGFLNGLAPPEP
jgi:putative hydrolase of the HAD superfamily